MSITTLLCEILPEGRELELIRRREVQILRLLRARGPLRPVEIQGAGVPDGTLFAVLRALESRHLIARAECGLVSPTPEGLGLLARWEQAAELVSR